MDPLPYLNIANPWYRSKRPPRGNHRSEPIQSALRQRLIIGKQSSRRRRRLVGYNILLAWRSLQNRHRIWQQRLCTRTSCRLHLLPWRTITSTTRPRHPPSTGPYPGQRPRTVVSILAHLFFFSPFFNLISKSVFQYPFFHFPFEVYHIPHFFFFISYRFTM